MKIVRRSPEPFFYPGGEIGLLLVHGFTGSPAELRPMGDYFRKRGISVHAPLLKGHGTSPEELAGTTWMDWRESVLQAYDRLCRDAGVRRVFAAGLSMGGLLVLDLARHRPLDGVISMCAPIWLKDRRAVFAPLVRFFRPYLPRREVKEAHIEEHLVPYDRLPLVSVGHLLRLIRQVRRRLPEITVPALVIQSERDETVEPSSGRYILKRLGSEEKEFKSYANSSHIITLDRERERLFADVENFIQRVTREEIREEK
ncbi:carboxylesterase [Planifilum fimeticola]|jgi:carboxylesterase|uniref:Carboxylesterase n=1 Tax=Planifilum fimeticola TaxID=201975 RepID=A0A2T0LGT9_9BACL|nr:alpha/beta fold hydrolase [Planifilum fimeticola]PRX41501.1 carboxylesterase [Planifilum fimeticola]